METATMEMEQKQVIETEIAPMLERAKSLVIRSQEDRRFAAETVKSFKEMRERIEDVFHPTKNKQTAYKAYTDALDSEKAFYGPIDEAEKLTKAAIKTFDTQEAIKAQKEAELAEAKRRDEEAKRAEKLEAQAQKAEERGNIEKAEALREQAQAPVAPSFTPPPTGTKKLTTKAEVINRMKLCKLIAEGVIPFSVIEINQAQLNAWAKTQDPKAQFDGIRLYQEANGRV